MKWLIYPILIVASIFLVVMVAAIIYDNSDAKAARVAEGWRKMDEVQARAKDKTDRDLLIATANLVSMRYGDATAGLYIKCHQEPPSQEENKARCEKLEERIARDDARDKARADAERKSW